MMMMMMMMMTATGAIPVNPTFGLSLLFLNLSLLTVPSPTLIIFFKITNCMGKIEKQHHSKVLLNSFVMNGHTGGFVIESKNLVSHEVSLWESKEIH